ncbi:S-layer homology domain-containing protein [Jeotgalibacillus malaysiensis]|uniref:S-layer homology domain-containing protein n=1 Tax=Jeotgalibacillus malaysiensis TaxID=1508404 RepID=UPI00384A8208
MKKVLIGALGLSFFAAAPAQAASFSDVSQYKSEINYLTEQGIIKGYQDVTFAPAKNVARLQAVQMILREMGVTDFTAPDPGFTDLKSGDYGYAEVAKAVELGFISGKTDRNGNKFFDPYGSLSRAQMAKILSVAYDLEKEWRYYFNDVKRGHWAKDYIDVLASEAITTGYEDQTFRPENLIQRQHFALFMARLLNEDFVTTSNQKNISYLMDTEKTYVFSEEIDGEYDEYVFSYEGIYAPLNIEWDIWYSTYSSGDEYEEIYTEYDNELRIGYPESEYYTVLTYPLYEGQVWTDFYYEEEGDEYKITDVDATVTTPAGTFEHVIAQESIGYGQTVYFAPNIGMIKVEDTDPDDGYNFEVELVEIIE